MHDAIGCVARGYVDANYGAHWLCIGSGNMSRCNVLSDAGRNRTINGATYYCVHSSGVDVNWSVTKLPVGSPCTNSSECDNTSCDGGVCGGCVSPSRPLANWLWYNESKFFDSPAFNVFNNLGCFDYVCSDKHLYNVSFVGAVPAAVFSNPQVPVNISGVIINLPICTLLDGFKVNTVNKYCQDNSYSSGSTFGQADNVQCAMWNLARKWYNESDVDLNTSAIQCYDAPGVNLTNSTGSYIYFCGNNTDNVCPDDFKTVMGCGVNGICAQNGIVDNDCKKQTFMKCPIVRAYNNTLPPACNINNATPAHMYCPNVGVYQQCLYYDKTNTAKCFYSINVTDSVINNETNSVTCSSGGTNICPTQYRYIIDPTDSLITGPACRPAQQFCDYGYPGKYLYNCSKLLNILYDVPLDVVLPTDYSNISESVINNIKSHYPRLSQTPLVEKVVMT